MCRIAATSSGCNLIRKRATNRPDTDRESVVLTDQVKSLDWKVRKAVKKETASIDVIAERLSKLQPLL